MTDTVYYLTGRGGQLDKGLGEALLEAGYEVSGREMSGEFSKLRFQNQIDTISRDLQGDFWTKESKVVAVSYGAYLLLHALADLESYVGRILLLSPILGGVTNGTSMHYFSPPRSDKIMKNIANGMFPIPNRIEVHVGDNDWQSPYQQVKEFTEAIGGNYNVVSETGHHLAKSYVTYIIDKWHL